MSVVPPASASRASPRGSIRRCTVILTRKLVSTSVSKRRRTENNDAEEWREYLSTRLPGSKDDSAFNDSLRADPCFCAPLLRPNPQSGSAIATSPAQAGGFL